MNIQWMWSAELRWVKIEVNNFLTLVYRIYILRQNDQKPNPDISYQLLDPAVFVRI